MLSPAYRADIQGLRAIAVLLVVAYHANLPVPGGFAGVDVFFVISGFVITSMLTREIAQTGTIDLARFYFRRFKRLAPALLVVIVASLLASIAVGMSATSLRLTAATAVGAAGLNANTVLYFNSGDYFAPASDENVLLHTWTLSIEEQFYLVFPIALLLVARRASGRALTLVLVAAFAVTLGGTVAAWVLSARLPLLGLAFHFYSPLARAWEFLAGALLAWCCAGRSPRGAGVLGLAALALLGAAAAYPRMTPNSKLSIVMAVVAAVLLLAEGMRERSRLADLLGCRPLTAIGDHSYSIYLCHWPCIAMAKALLPDLPLAPLAGAILSAPLAAASYRYVEQPIRSLEVRSRSRQLGLLASSFAAAVGVLFAVSGAIPVATAALYSSNPGDPDHLARASGCDEGRGLLAGHADQCTWNGAATGPPIYLVGDSNAEQFAEGLVVAGARVGRPVRIATKGGCAVVLLDTLDDDLPGNSGPCHAYVLGAIAWLHQQPPGLVVMAASDQYWHDPRFSARDMAGGPWTRSSPEKVDLLERGLGGALDAVRAPGHSVLLVQTIPLFNYRGPSDERVLFDLRACARVTLDRCVRVTPRAVRDAVQGPSHDRVALVAARAGIPTLDFTPEYCTSLRCSTFDDGHHRYRDATHINVAESERLAPRFADAITGAR